MIRKSILFILFICLLITGYAVLTTVKTPEPLAEEASTASSALLNDSEIKKSEILWDTWGVPHIYATGEKDLYYGMGWAQMHSHGDLLMKLYAEARGEGAKYLGESALELTKHLHTMGIPALGKEYLEFLTPDEQMMMESFVAGINAYAAVHPNHIAEHLQDVLPIKTSDVNAHSLRNFFIEFIGNQELGKAKGEEIGSNTWAVSPKRSASGNALLLANPHLRYDDLWLFYEAHFNMDDYSLYGAALVGLPVINIAFNEHLGWTHTNNTLDAADLYRLKLKDDGYLLDGQKKDFKLKVHNIPVLQEDGTMRTEKLVVKNSIHGPVIKMGNEEAISLRVARLDNPGNFLDQWKKMGQAKNLEEFQTALAQNDLPMFNVMYADKVGNIFYHFAGHIPKRHEGDWDFWSGIVPGDDSKYLWNEYHTYEERPQLLNPKSGWMQNANDPPYTVTIPTELNPKDYPAYMAPTKMELRPQRAAHIMMEDDQITFDEFVAYKHDTKMELALRLLDDLLALETPAANDMQKAAFEILKEWDGQANADSEGAVLFAKWHVKITGGDFYNNDYFAQGWSFDKADSTPDGLKDGAGALKALETAANELTAAHGKLNVPWGEVNKVSFGDKEVAGNGGQGWLGEFRTMYYAPQGKAGTPKGLVNRAVAGETYVAAIEFGERPTAKALLTYGNATQKGNPHIGDQLDLFAQKELRKVWYERADVEANLEKREEIVR